MLVSTLLDSYTFSFSLLSDIPLDGQAASDLSLLLMYIRVAFTFELLKKAPLPFSYWLCTCACVSDGHCADAELLGQRVSVSFSQRVVVADTLTTCPSAPAASRRCPHLESPNFPHCQLVGARWDLRVTLVRDCQ